MFGYTTIFRKVQGLVGKTLLSHKPCFCRDITQLSLNEYPFLNYAREFKLTQCFTTCLRSISSGVEDYVLEFFLPPNEEPEYPQNLLDSLLATMKENFQSFKVASGEELGEELRVEVYKSLNDNEDESFRICQPKRSLSQPEALENEREIMAPDQQLVVKDAKQATSAVAHTSRNVYQVTVKATYKDDVIIRFELASSSGMGELQENVTQRLHLEKGNFSIKYQDEEGDWVLIACDNDLKTCMDISRSLKKTTIKMSIDPPITHY